nr:hypothetical protein [Tanacetum cinerariifolium]
MRPFGCLVTILNTLDSLGKFDRKVDEGFLVGYSVSSGPTWLFDIDTLTKTMTYQPVTAGNQSNLVQNIDGDVAFNEKEPEFEGRKPESKVNVSPRSSAQSKKHDDKTKREAKGKKLEDITYSDDEDDVGPDADFNNLETSITITTQTKSMTRVAKEQGGISQINNDDFYTCMFACFLSQEEPKRVHQALKDPSWIEGFEDPNYPDKVYKVVKALYGLHQDPKACLTDGKSTNTPTDIEKPLLKDLDGEDVDAHTYSSNQTVSGKDSSNPLMADNLPKIILYSAHNVALMKSWLVQKQTALGVNKPRSDEDRLELLELTVFLLPSDKKVGIKVSAVDLQVSAVMLILLFSIKYALTVNHNIYVSCIKQFWTSVAVKKVNDVTRLQALVDKKKVIITKATIRDALCLDDAEGIKCLSNEEIFTELARMGYEKPSTKLTFYKAFFSSQWKFLIHTILQCMSAKRTSWDEFSSSMASAVICLSTSRNFNFSKVGKGCSGVETPLFKGIIVKRRVDKGAAEVHVEDVSTAGVAAEGDVSAADDVVSTTVEEPYIPSSTPLTSPLQPSQDQPSTSQDAGISIDFLQNLMDTCKTLIRRVENLENDKIAQALKITKLKQRVKKLERRNKASKLLRLKKVGTAQRIETSC